MLAAAGRRRRGDGACRGSAGTQGSGCLARCWRVRGSAGGQQRQLVPRSTRRRRCSSLLLAPPPPRPRPASLFTFTRLNNKALGGGDLSQLAANVVLSALAILPYEQAARAGGDADPAAAAERAVKMAQVLGFSVVRLRGAPHCGIGWRRQSVCGASTVCSGPAAGSGLAWLARRGARCRRCPRRGPHLLPLPASAGAARRAGPAVARGADRRH